MLVLPRLLLLLVVVVRVRVPAAPRASTMDRDDTPDSGTRPSELTSSSCAVKNQGFGVSGRS